MPNDYEEKFKEIKSQLRGNYDDTHLLSKDEIDAIKNQKSSFNRRQNTTEYEYYESLVKNIKKKIEDDEDLKVIRRYKETAEDYHQPVDTWDEYDNQKNRIKGISISKNDIFSVNIDSRKAKDDTEIKQFIKELRSNNTTEIRSTKKSNKKEKINYLLFFLLFTLATLSIISTHSTKLIIKPINYIVIGTTIVLLIIETYKLVSYTLNKKKKKEKRHKIIKWLLSLYAIGCISFCFVLYGPIKTFQNWLITTAMQTMNHQYFCKWFYGDEEIAYVMSNNYVLESGESTDESLIDTSGEFDTNYKDKYEAQIFEGYKKGDTYKIIKLNVNGCKGYLGVIYDPKTVSLAVTKNLGVAGQHVTQMAKDHNAVLAINGGGFYDPGNNSAGGTPTGITISNGKLVTNGEYGTQTQGGGLIGFTDKNVFVLLKNKTAQEALNMGVRDAVTWGPFLIVNGEPSFIKGNGGWGYAARTAIGQREDGIVLFLVVDSNAVRTKGADMIDLTTIMKNYGAVNAANLDGGTSSVMVENGELINDPIDGDLKHQTRGIADAFIVTKK